VGLLKCPKDRLEDEWHCRFPWSRCLLPAVKAEREGVHLWPELSNLEVIGKKLT